MKEKVSKSRNRSRYIKDESVSNPKLHLTFAVSDITNTLYFIDELVFRSLNPDTNPVKVLFVNIARSDRYKNGLTYGSIDTSIL